MLKRITLLGWLIIAVLLIDAGMDLLARDYFGAARGLILVALLPFVFRHARPRDEPGPSGAAR